MKEKMGSELVNFDDQKQVQAFLNEPSEKIGEFAVGLLLAEKKDFLVSGVKLVGAWLKGNFYRQLGREVRLFTEKGVIKENFFSDSYSRQTMIELLKFIDEGNLDSIKFNAMKSIFLKGIETKESQEALAYELFQIAKTLSSNDFLVLRAIYEISQKKFKNDLIIENVSGERSAQNWLNYVARQLGHELSGLVEISEKSLMEAYLITGRQHADRSGIQESPSFRLTSLGETLCLFILEFEWTL